jgi:membrane protease YdiL (CAAX protease family)
MEMKNNNSVCIQILRNPRCVKIAKVRIGGVICVVLFLVLYNTIVDFGLLALNLDVVWDTFGNISSLALLSALVFAPIIEEIIFRTHLSGRSIHSWSLLLMLCAVLIANFNHNRTVMIVFFFILVPAMILVLFSTKAMMFIFRKYFNYTFYITALLFSLMHFTAVNKDVQSWSQSLGITLFAFFPVAIVFGLVRRKYGLVFSILTHCINNILVLTLNSMIF